jgi:hypothetical protein
MPLLRTTTYAKRGQSYLAPRLMSWKPRLPPWAISRRKAVAACFQLSVSEADDCPECPSDWTRRRWRCCDARRELHHVTE